MRRCDPRVGLVATAWWLRTPQLTLGARDGRRRLSQFDGDGACRTPRSAPRASGDPGPFEPRTHAKTRERARSEAPRQRRLLFIQSTEYIDHAASAGAVLHVSRVFGGPHHWASAGAEAEGSQPCNGYANSTTTNLSAHGLHVDGSY